MIRPTSRGGTGLEASPAHLRRECLNVALDYLLPGPLFTLRLLISLPRGFDKQHVDVSPGKLLEGWHFWRTYLGRNSISQCRAESSWKNGVN